MKEAALTNPLCGAKTRSGKPCEKFPLAVREGADYMVALVQGPKQRQDEPQ